MVDLICAFSLGVLAAEFPAVRVPILTLLPIAGALLGATRKTVSNWLVKDKPASLEAGLPKLPVFRKPPVKECNIQDLHIADVFPPGVDSESSIHSKPKVVNPWKVDVPATPVPTQNVEAGYGGPLPTVPVNEVEDSEVDASNLFVGHKSVPNPWTVISPETPIEMAETPVPENSPIEADEDESQAIDEVEEGQIIEEETHEDTNS